MRVRAVLPACLAAATVLSLTAFPAQANPSTTVFIDDAAGDTVSAAHTLHVTTAAPAVLFVARDGDGAATQYVSSDAVAPVGSDATWDWATWGFTGPVTVQAFDCTDAVNCPDPSTATPDASLSLTVDNAVTDFGAPVSDTTVYPDTPSLDVTVPSSAGDGDLSLVWGSKSTPVTNTGAPTTIDFADVTDADTTHLLAFQRCNQDNQLICAIDGTSTTTLRVLRAITTALTLGGAVTGPKQSKTLGTESVAFDPTLATGGTWTLTNTDGTPVPGATPHALDVSSSPAHFTVAPAALGLTSLADGDYKVVVTATGDHGLTGTDSQTVTWDATAPVITSVTSSASTFYPYPDGYHDTVNAQVAAPADGGGTGTLQVRSSTGAVVRTFTNRTLVDGTTVSWNGTNNGGKRVPAGRYRFRTILTDAAGNTDTDTSSPFTVSAKRLVVKHFRTVVTAQRSLVENDSGRCSSLRKPGLELGAGSVGYYSESKCTGRPRDGSQLAFGIHLVKVPSAVSYGTLAMRAYGRAAKPRSRAIAFLVNSTGANSGSGPSHWLTGAAGWHSMGSYAKSRNYIQAGRRVAWAVVEGGGLRYDVSKFEVTLAYKVLQ